MWLNNSIYFRKASSIILGTSSDDDFIIFLGKLVAMITFIGRNLYLISYLIFSNFNPVLQ